MFPPELIKYFLENHPELLIRFSGINTDTREIAQIVKTNNTTKLNNPREIRYLPWEVIHKRWDGESVKVIFPGLERWREMTLVCGDQLFQLFWSCIRNEPEKVKVIMSQIQIYDREELEIYRDLYTVSRLLKHEQVCKELEIIKQINNRPPFEWESFITKDEMFSLEVYDNEEMRSVLTQLYPKTYVREEDIEPICYVGGVKLLKTMINNEEVDWAKVYEDLLAFVDRYKNDIWFFRPSLDIEEILNMIGLDVSRKTPA